eukprot:10740426-Alexandrium_andersonii.AAC.1
MCCWQFLTAFRLAQPASWRALTSQLGATAGSRSAAGRPKSATSIIFAGCTAPATAQGVGPSSRSSTP